MRANHQYITNISTHTPINAFVSPAKFYNTFNDRAIPPTFIVNDACGLLGFGSVKLISSLEKPELDID